MYFSASALGISLQIIFVILSDAGGLLTVINKHGLKT